MSIFAIDSDSNNFNVYDVKIFSDSGTLADSKAIAIDKGISESLKSLMLKITPENMHNRIIIQKNIDNSSLVKSYNIKDERMTSHSYMATVDFYFDQNKVKALLNQLGVMYAERKPLSILVVPILYKDKKYHLWKTTDWKSAWDSMPEQVGMISNIIIIKGDIDDVKHLNAGTAMIDSYDHFKPLFDKYNVASIVVISAEDNDDEIDVAIRTLDSGHDKSGFINYSKTQKESDMVNYKRIARDILSKIDEEYKGVKVFDQDVAYNSNVWVKVDDLKSWSKIKNILNSIEYIKDFKVYKTSVHLIELDLQYTVNPNTLSELLLQKGIKVTKHDNDTKLYLELVS